MSRTRAAILAVVAVVVLIGGSHCGSGHSGVPQPEGDSTCPEGEVYTEAGTCAVPWAWQNGGPPGDERGTS